MMLIMVWRPAAAAVADAAGAANDAVRGGGAAVWLQALRNRTPRTRVGVRMAQGVL
jgi:hypothetical protein